MTDDLEDGVAWALSQIKANASQTVSYVHENGTIPDIQATPGDSDIDEIGGISLVQTKRSDWLIDAADLVHNGQSLRPKEGDQIVFGAKTYKVTPLMEGEACFTPEDPYGKIFRIHVILTKDTSS